MHISLFTREKSERYNAQQRKIHVAVPISVPLRLWENTAIRKKGPGFLKLCKSVSETFYLKMYARAILCEIVISKDYEKTLMGT